MRDTQLSMDRFQPASAHPSPDEVPPGYKRTEVGVIPEDWEIKRLGDITSIRNQKTSPSDVDPNTLCVELEHIGQGDGRLLETATAQSSMSSKYRFFSGDVLFGRLRSYLRKFWHADRDGICTTEIWPLMADTSLVDSGFLYAIVQSNQFVEAASISYGTHMPRADWNVIKSFEVRLPPLPEQRAIAAALSDADGLIRALDELIEKKRAIKQATMQQLLTGKKRLPGFEDADAYKQIEGVTTPVDWSVTKLSQVCKEVLNGGTPSTKISEYWEGTIPWITGADVVGQKIEEVHKFITEEAVENSATNVVPKGNLLLVTRTGVGKVAIAPFDIAISQDLTGFILTKNTNVEYLYWIFNRASKHLLNMSQGTSIGGIKKDDLMNFTLFLPPLPEQRAIATILSDMDAEIAALKRRREKTQQIKQGMMQELLTGRTHLIDPPEEAPA